MFGHVCYHAPDWNTAPLCSPLHNKPVHHSCLFCNLHMIVVLWFEETFTHYLLLPFFLFNSPLPSPLPFSHTSPQLSSPYPHPSGIDGTQLTRSNSLSHPNLSIKAEMPSHWSRGCVLCSVRSRSFKKRPKRKITSLISFCLQTFRQKQIIEGTLTDWCSVFWGSKVTNSLMLRLILSALDL